MGTPAAMLRLGCREASAQFRLPNIRPDKIVGQLGAVNPKKVADALQGPVADKLKDQLKDKLKSVSGDAAHQAVQALRGAGVDVKSSNMTQPLQAVGSTLQEAATGLQASGGDVRSTLEKTGQRTQELASAVHNVLPKDVQDKVKHADPHQVSQVLDTASGKIAEALKNTNVNRIQHIFAEDKKKIEEVMEAMETVDWWSTNWHWAFIALSIVACSVAGGIQCVRRIKSKGARSPNLLVDAEINMYVRPGLGRQHVPNEETLFTQF